MITEILPCNNYYLMKLKNCMLGCSVDILCSYMSTQSCTIQTMIINFMTMFLFLHIAGDAGLLGDQFALLNLSNIVPQDPTSKTLVWYSKNCKTTRRHLA